MNLATLAYIPPARLNADAFVRNVMHFKSEHPVIWYSDRDLAIAQRIPDPTKIKLSKNRVAIHNRIFLHGLEIASRMKLDRFIYLESDSRVCRDYWDRIIFNEAAEYRDMFAAGTPAIYNETALTEKQRLVYDKASEKCMESTGFNVTRFKARMVRPMAAWFIMGSCACYNTAIMADLFMGFERDASQKAIKVPAFDLFIGMRCHQLFGTKSVSKLPYLTSVFSTFGNKVNSEKERIEMAKSGKWSAIHQIKSNMDCL